MEALLLSPPPSAELGFDYDTNHKVRAGDWVISHLTLCVVHKRRGNHILIEEFIPYPTEQARSPPKFMIEIPQDEIALLRPCLLPLQWHQNYSELNRRFPVLKPDLLSAQNDRNDLLPTIRSDAKLSKLYDNFLLVKLKSDLDFIKAVERVYDRALALKLKTKLPGILATGGASSGSSSSTTPRTPSGESTIIEGMGD